MTAPSDILFGYGVAEVNKTRLAKMLGVSTSTVCRWKEKPWTIPLHYFAEIVLIRHLSNEETASVLKGVRKHDTGRKNCRTYS